MDDIHLATEWTYLNVRHLGGDPNNITLAGQSAGAHICLCLLVNAFLNAKVDEDAQCHSRHVLPFHKHMHHTEVSIDHDQERMEHRPPLPATPPSSLMSNVLHSTPPSPERLTQLGLFLPLPDPSLSIPVASGVVVEEVCLDRSSSNHSDCESVWRDLDSVDLDYQPRVKEPALTVGVEDDEGYHEDLVCFVEGTRQTRPVTADKATNTSVEDLFLWSTPFSAARRRVGSLQGSPSFSLLATVKKFVGVSGPYNLTALKSHFQQRGLDASILQWICRGDVARYSPTELLRQFSRGVEDSLPPPVAALFTSNPSSSSSSHPPAGPLAAFPPVLLIHGSKDKTIPVSISAELEQVLTSGGCPLVSALTYSGWSHTDPILEGPLAGDLRLFQDIRSFVFEAERGEGEEVSLMSDAPPPPPATPPLQPRPMISRLLARVARRINPF